MNSMGVSDEVVAINEGSTKKQLLFVRRKKKEGKKRAEDEVVRVHI